MTFSKQPIIDTISYQYLLYWCLLSSIKEVASYVILVPGVSVSVRVYMDFLLQAINKLHLPPQVIELKLHPQKVTERRIRARPLKMAITLPTHSKETHQESKTRLP